MQKPYLPYSPSSGALTDTVPREALLQKMKTLCANSHLYLSAPGGYGKTIAARQWLAGVRGKTAVLVAGEADNDPGPFHKKLAAVLTKLTGREKLLRTIIGASPIEELLALISLLPKRGTRAWLFIDDFHMIRNTDILHDMALVIERLPAFIICLLAGRGGCPPQLFATGRFALIDKSDLLFSPAEVEWLGAEKDRDLTPGQIRSLLDITGGWAMYLAAILSDQRVLDEKRAKETPQSLSQYLKTQVWEKWDRETKLLLLSLSIARELTPGLCERLSGQTDGRAMLEGLAARENTFLFQENDDTWRFHDVFHDFLTGLSGRFLGAAETRRLNTLAAEWFFEQDDFYTSARHFIQNLDHAGINRCMDATTLYSGKMGALSVINRLEFFERHVLGLPAAFIAENPLLIGKCAVAAYYGSDIEIYFRHVDTLYAKKREIFSRHPNLIETYLFVTTFDPRVPLKKCVMRVFRQITSLPPAMAAKRMTAYAQESKAAQTTTISQTLPYFHRSMRDFSEYHDLRDSDLKMLAKAFGGIIGRDFRVMEPLIIAGLRYEQGGLLDAIWYAMAALRACDPDTHPEVSFCAQAILCAVLYAADAAHEADRIMTELLYNIESNEFLRLNGKAFHSMYLIRKGDTHAAREWLTLYAAHSERLPFHQICRHFATLRSHIALEEYTAAAIFGRRLLALVTRYRRPLDQIETGLLLALALWRDGQKKEALRHLEQAAAHALPYGFTQLFVNEGEALLPLLLAHTSPAAKVRHFLASIKKEIYQRHGMNPGEEPAPILTARQYEMLTYLEKGFSYSQIATACGLARGTVKVHVLSLYKRLGVHDMGEALTKARMLGIIVSE